ncbi:MAG: sensor histidine kinase [Janthinobacterium lividum]
MNDYRSRLIGILTLSFLIALLTRPLHGFGTSPAFLVSWGISLYFTAALWLGNRALWAWLLGRLPHVDQTARRLVALVGLSAVFTVLATVVLRAPLRLLLPAYFPFSWSQELFASSFNFLPTCLVNIFYESLYFFQQWQQNQHRADQLAQAQTQAQLDALAQQLDPHFLFNSLNTLAALIEPANDDAQHYLEGLADVYRYVLLSRERPTVPLAEELAFVRTYVALQKVRFRENVRVSYDIPTPALARSVAPLSVQLLVENALKHNEASQARPLHLRLVANAEATALRVENTYQPRAAGLAPGTGTGLANVRQRYALLGAGQPVQVVQAGSTFAVVLPLLPT